MRIDVNGTRLWFDVDGPALVPDGREMRQRPTVELMRRLDILDQLGRVDAPTLVPANPSRMACSTGAR